MSSEAIVRKPNRGQFQPGNRANPGGRPKSAVSVTDALRRRLEKGAAEKIADRLIYLATQAKQEAVQVKAAQEVTDRTEGRPMQAIAMLQVMDDNTANRLVQLASILTGNHLSHNETPITLSAETVGNVHKALPKPSHRKLQKSKSVVTNELSDTDPEAK